jgi:glutamate racemase
MRLALTPRGIESLAMSTRFPADAPIGVFDSGVGGLTVLKALRERLPGEDFVYVGDTARLPYGRKPPEMVREFARQISNFLVSEGVKAVVMACNTASSCALPSLEFELSVPIWGVIEPGVEVALAISSGTVGGTGRVGVLGTKGTIASGAYQTRLEAKGLDVWARACPMFVPIVEEGLVNSAEARLLVEHYLHDRPALSALILGCTHYPILKPVISDYLGPDVALVDSAQVVSEVVTRDLMARDLVNPRAHQGEVIHYVTGDPSAYQHTARVIGGVEGELRLLEIEHLIAHGQKVASVAH